MALAVGQIALVRYAGHQMWHERLICAVVAHPEFVVCTPTLDFFAEELALTNPDLSGLTFYLADGGRPPGVGPQHVFGFPAMDAVRLFRLLAEGELLAVAERAAQGIPAAAPAPAPAVGAAAVPPPAGVVVPVAAVQPAADAPGSVWVLDEPMINQEVGDVIPVPADAPRLGDRAFVMIGNEVAVCRLLLPGASIIDYAAARRDFLADDDRVLATPLIRVGGEFRPLALSCIESTISLPLEGPRTAKFLVSEVVKLGIGNFSSRHQKWLRDSGVDPNSRAVHEHRLLSKVLDLALLFDRFNIVNSACFELVFRRMQLMEDVHADDPRNPSWQGAELYMGLAERPGGALMAPSLRKYVADELGREAAILKEKRKAREAKGNPKAAAKAAALG